MSPQRPKTKTIFCRVPDEEYKRLVEICECRGNNVSVLLRTALEEFLSREHYSDDPVLTQLSALTFMVEVLQKEIEGLHAFIRYRFGAYPGNSLQP